MHRYQVILAGMLLLIGMLVGICLGAEDDERFLGGCYDGYDLCTLPIITIQSAIPSGTIVTLH